jgi:hypothetical protein
VEQDRQTHSGSGGSGQELSGEELATEQAVDLPDREAMTSIDASLGSGIDNFAMPINEASATNLYSSSSVAIADADQIVILDQVDTDVIEEPADEPIRKGPKG